MFTVWMIWIRADDTTWLHDAWDDDGTAENPEGWKAAVRKAKEYALANDGEVRIQRVHVPSVDDLFDIPSVEAKPSV